MESTLLFRYILILFITGSSTVTFGQTNIEKKNYYNWFDKNIGKENSSLFNGELYTKSYRTENKDHNFLINNDFVKGAIEFNKQNYYDILLKYDIYKDELIAKLESSLGNNSYVQLNKAFINGFTLHNKTFKFINISTETTTLNGFFEVSHSSSVLTLYTKHHKVKEEYIVDKLVYNKFPKKDYNVLFYQNNYYKINSKKDLKRIFPNKKKEISVLYKKNKRLKKVNKNTLTKTIIQQIEQSL